MNPAELKRWKELEFSARRSGALHPDDCPKLKIKKVQWAIPPRGSYVRPEFTPEGVQVRATEDTQYPEAERLAELVPIQETGICETCKRPRGAEIEVDQKADADFIRTCFGLAAKLLDKQYQLSDSQKVELLTFSATQLPEWIPQLVRWAFGLPTEPGPTNPLEMLDGPQAES